MNEIEAKIIYVIASIYCLAGIIVFVIEMFKQDKFSSIWKTYVLEFFIIIAIFFPVYTGSYVLLAAALIIGSSCLYDMSFALVKCGFAPCLRIAIGVNVMFITLAYYQQYTLLTASFIFFVIYILIYSTLANLSLENVMGTMFAVCYPGIFFSYFVLIASLEGGFRYVAFLYILTEINDSAAHVVGKYFGKTKIWENISPNKTYVGSIAGIIIAMITGFFLHFAIPEWNQRQLITIVIIIAIFTQLGDLVASKIKRTAKIKDYGDFIPTQGGMLDLFDSLIFTSPIFYYYLIYTVIG